MSTGGSVLRELLNSSDEKDKAQKKWNDAQAAFFFTHLESGGAIPTITLPHGYGLDDARIAGYTGEVNLRFGGRLPQPLTGAVAGKVWMRIVLQPYVLDQPFFLLYGLEGTPIMGPLHKPCVAGPGPIWSALDVNAATVYQTGANYIPQASGYWQQCSIPAAVFDPATNIYYPNTDDANTNIANTMNGMQWSTTTLSAANTTATSISNCWQLPVHVAAETGFIGNNNFIAAGFAPSAGAGAFTSYAIWSEGCLGMDGTKYYALPQTTNNTTADILAGGVIIYADEVASFLGDSMAKSGFTYPNGAAPAAWVHPACDSLNRSETHMSNAPGDSVLDSQTDNFWQQGNYFAQGSNPSVGYQLNTPSLVGKNAWINMPLDPNAYYGRTTDLPPVFANTHPYHGAVPQGCPNIYPFNTEAVLGQYTGGIYMVTITVLNGAEMTYTFCGSRAIRAFGTQELGSRLGTVPVPDDPSTNAPTMIQADSLAAIESSFRTPGFVNATDYKIDPTLLVMGKLESLVGSSVQLSGATSIGATRSVVLAYAQARSGLCEFHEAFTGFSLAARGITAGNFPSCDDYQKSGWDLPYLNNQSMWQVYNGYYDVALGQAAWMGSTDGRMNGKANGATYDNAGMPPFPASTYRSQAILKGSYMDPQGIDVCYGGGNGLPYYATQAGQGAYTTSNCGPVITAGGVTFNNNTQYNGGRPFFLTSVSTGWGGGNFPFAADDSPAVAAEPPLAPFWNNPSGTGLQFDCLGGVQPGYFITNSTGPNGYQVIGGTRGLNPYSYREFPLYIPGAGPVYSPVFNTMRYGGAKKTAEILITGLEADGTPLTSGHNGVAISVDTFGEYGPVFGSIDPTIPTISAVTSGIVEEVPGNIPRAPYKLRSRTWDETEGMLIPTPGPQVPQWAGGPGAPVQALQQTFLSVGNGVRKQRAPFSPYQSLAAGMPVFECARTDKTTNTEANVVGSIRSLHYYSLIVNVSDNTTLYGMLDTHPIEPSKIREEVALAAGAEGGDGATPHEALVNFHRNNGESAKQFAKDPVAKNVHQLAIASGTVPNDLSTTLAGAGSGMRRAGTGNLGQSGLAGVTNSEAEMEKVATMASASQAIGNMYSGYPGAFSGAQQGPNGGNGLFGSAEGGMQQQNPLGSIMQGFNQGAQMMRQIQGMGQQFQGMSRMFGGGGGGGGFGGGNQGYAGGYQNAMGGGEGFSAGYMGNEVGGMFGGGEGGMGGLADLFAL